MSEIHSNNSGRRSPTRKRTHIPSIATATSLLLTATKSMLQTLTLWSEKTAEVTDVSYKFVKFGDAFKTLKKSYTHLGVDISNLPDIPTMVRNILESSLILEPSAESLETFLPKIGDAIASLMKTLKDKQGEVNALEISKKNGSLSASSSLASIKGADTSATSILSTRPNSTITPNTEINRTPSKDAITRLQNNTDLKRRASKRYSAFQTSTIISMQSPKSGKIFDSIEMPKAPLYDSLSPDVTAEDIEKAKHSSDLFEIEEVESLNGDVILAESPIQEEKIEDKNVLSTPPTHESESLNYTTNALTGLRRTSQIGLSHTQNQLEEPKNTGKVDLFLKLKERVKKIQVELPTSLVELKTQFTQKFDYYPPGITPFPKFNVQDGPNSITYELESITDIKAGSIISLQQPDMQTAILQQIESQMNNMKNDMMNMEDRIYKKFEELQTTQKYVTPQPISKTDNINSGADYEKELKNRIDQTKEQQKIIDDLQEQVKRVKQHQIRTSSRLVNAVETTITNVEKLQDLGLVPANVSENDYVKDCKLKVSDGCESLVEKLDDLQDVIEFMKRDITKHNIKPSQKQIEHLAKEMKKTKTDLSNFTDFTKLERKSLSVMWTKQMATIAADQRFFKAQEEIIGLLEQDYQSAQETFELIISCAKQLEKGSLLNKAKLPVSDPSISPWDASKLVMAEVDGIIPNHEERIEAILKAERVREMEKELRLKDEFKEELDDFVSNEKLKKGALTISELEKLRQEKDMESFKNTMGII